MGIGEWVGLSSLLVTNIGAVYLTYNNFNRKINRIYERFDEYKTHSEDNADNKYVQKDLCGVVHSNNSNNLSGLEDRIEKRFDKLDAQIDRLINK